MLYFSILSYSKLSELNCNYRRKQQICRLSLSTQYASLYQIALRTVSCILELRELNKLDESFTVVLLVFFFNRFGGALEIQRASSKQETPTDSFHFTGAAEEVIQ